MKTDRPWLEPMVAVLGAILDDRKATYVSCPITSGKRLYEFNLSHGVSCTADDVQFRDPLRRYVIEPNLEDQRKLIAKVRHQIAAPILNPAKLPSLPGWRQGDYYFLWELTIRSYVQQAVFADGWEYSSGCTHEYLVAHRVGVRCFDTHMEPLPLGKAESLIQSAISDLRNRGADASFLELNHRELCRSRKTAYIDFEPTTRLPQARGRSDELNWLVAMLDCVLDQHSAVCVGSPICGGQEYFKWAETAYRYGAIQMGGDFQEVVPSVLEANIKHALAFGQQVRDDVGHYRVVEPIRSGLIDTTADRQFERFWLKVLSRFCNELRLADDWPLSVGCAREFQMAARVGLTVRNARGHPLTIEDGSRLLADSIARMKRAGFHSGPFQSVMDDLARPVAS